jgi:hypothetical protein
MTWEIRTDIWADSESGAEVKFTAWWTGVGNPEEADLIVVDLTKLKPVPHVVRIDSILYSATSGVEGVLAWHEPSGARVPIAALAGRGRMDKTKFQDDKKGSTSGNIEVLLQPLQGRGNFEMFTVQLELTKQGA